ncbi:MAG: class II fumarate hydratase [Candidatus Tectomicrobia bacterium]|nr:class II fumarate hydratase [Candidatus Tectomicrobia bacterium]
MEYRVERDSMGEMQVPGDALYGASTQRAVLNFPVSGKRFPRVFFEALGAVKAAAATANMKLGKLDPKLGEPIRKAALEVREGKHDAHFVVDIYQTGSGTSTNTNANEVVANLANLGLGQPIGAKSPVHPNDHVNMGQSSNDVIPTAIHVSALLDIERRLLPALKALGDSLGKKADEFRDVIKTGRTHLQDATPVTLGQEFSGYAVQIHNCRRRIAGALENLRELAIGGTAVGTGINTHPDFARLVCEDLSGQFKTPFREAPNHFESLAAKDTCVEVSGALKVLAVALTKIANDIRWLSSGPRTGIGEITIPETQPGSSIMPGKVNPVIAESVLQAAAQVMGNDVAVAVGGAAGNFELNVMMPVIAYNLLDSVALLAGVCRIFREKCVDGIRANAERCRDTIERGLSLVTSFAPAIGYDRAAKLSQKAYRENKTIREVAREEGLFPEEEMNRLLDPRSMLQPEG